MQSARLAIQTAIGDAAKAALVAQGYDDVTPSGSWAGRLFSRKAPESASYPLGIIGDATEVRGSHSDKDVDEPDDTHAVRFYSRSSMEAMEIAARMIALVTGPDFAVPGFGIHSVKLAMSRPAPSELDPRLADVHGEIVGFRVMTYTL